MFVCGWSVLEFKVWISYIVLWDLSSKSRGRLADVIDSHKVSSAEIR